MRLEDVNLPEYLKRRVHSHVRGVGSQGRLTGTQALEVYRWAARWTVSNLGTNPKVSVKNSVPRISTQVSNLLPLESLPRGFNQKTTPVQKLEKRRQQSTGAPRASQPARSARIARKQLACPQRARMP